MNVVSFSSGALRASVCPEFGGRLASLQIETPAGKRDLIVPMTAWGDAPWRWPKAGAYPLIPYSNRIVDGLLRVGGRTAALRSHPDAKPHALHGPSHLRPWQVEHTSADKVTLVLNAPADDDWPWDYKAEQTYSLSGSTLTIRLSLTNTSKDSFPGGVGWHPFLPFEPGALVTHDARIRWMLDKEGIATGEQRPAKEPYARNEYLSDWSRAGVTYADGSALAFSGDALFSHLICHRPESDAYVCVEPVSHGSNGFNLAEAGVRGTGTISLPPGERISGEVRLTFVPSP